MGVSGSGEAVEWATAGEGGEAVDAGGDGAAEGGSYSAAVSICATSSGLTVDASRLRCARCGGSGSRQESNAGRSRRRCSRVTVVRDERAVVQALRRQVLRCAAVVGHRVELSHVHAM